MSKLAFTCSNGRCRSINTLAVLWCTSMITFYRAVSSLDGTCLRETTEGSHRYSFSGTIRQPVDGEADERQKLEYMQDYCVENFPDGQLANMDTLSRLVLSSGNLQPREVAKVCTSEIYGLLMGPVNEGDTMVYLAYQAKITDGKKSINSEICATNLNSRQTDCPLLNSFADSQAIMDLIDSRDPLWRTVTLSSKLGQVYKYAVSLETGSAVRKSCGFLCVHNPYSECKCHEQLTNCHYDKMSGSCVRQILSFLSGHPEGKKDCRCPSTLTITCECNEQMDDTVVFENPPCLNGGETAFRKDGSIYCKCGFLYAGERCDESIPVNLLVATFCYKAAFVLVVLLVLCAVLLGARMLCVKKDAQSEENIKLQRAHLRALHVGAFP
uniref:EGF-like domain-containing protein n=1 Tax=Trichuris muris TaxID=70415 RepID=A0A5S6R1B2_TRIMR